ncbi:MAG TPA: hypothetical protein VMR62_25820 [Bryobacteraceae bacterium]|jgi:hypothetical protein|nr:hypothetical protein [Bryobacteraceae bacterium]
MNVTGVEWRDSGEAEANRKFRHPSPRTRKLADDDDDVADVVEIHDPAEEETADGLDEFD